MPSNSTTRTRNRSSSNAYVEHEPPPSNWNQYHTPLVNHVSAVHHPETLKTPPLRPASVSKSGAGMSAASRYAHNLKVLRRRDPSILRIFDQFSHVCIYHHNGQSWEKKGFEGSMFLYERADYPPYGFYILNRMGMDDYIQRLWPEDNLSVTGSYLMLRTWPEWSRNRIRDIEASNGSKELHPFDERYKWDQETRPNEATEVSKTIGLWMFNTDAREPLITVMLRLHGFIRQNLPYPEKYRYGPDKPPPPNSSPSLANGAPNRTASAASTESGASTAHTGSASTDSSSHSQQHSPNAAYTNPLLYQISDSASTASADPKFLNAFVETPKVKGKIRKRKGKREKLFAESGDVTPMANGSNQVSDLNILFAKLVQPSASTDEANAESGYGPALPMSRGPLIPESSMGNGSLSNPASNPISMAVAHPPPVDQTTSTKLTLEGLFASVTSIPVDHQVYDAPNHRNAEDGFNHNHHQRSSPHSHSSSMPLATIKTQAGNAAHYSASPVKNTGLALLNDIFASASTSGLASSIISPSDSILQENISSEIEHHSTSVLSTIATSRDEPETIEIYSPRPQAPLSLATMFDAAVCDGTRSPSGLGLDVTSIEQDAGREGHQTILTQRVLDTLLDTGGSMDPEHDDDVKANTPNTPSEMNAEPEEVRRRLLHMIGLGSSSHFPYSHPKSNGDVTPRAIHKETPEPATTSSFGVPESLQHSTSHTDVSFADTEDVFDEGDEDDEPIVELDFSDTRALSDIHVFENRERVLREQLIERKAASRNASRSTTPAVISYEPISNSTKINEMNGVHSKTKVPISAFHGESRYGPSPASIPIVPATSPQRLLSSQVDIQPFSSTQLPKRVSTHIDETPAIPMPPSQTTPAQTNSANQRTPTGSPSKKKTRRGRGRGKDRDRGESKEGSPVPVINGTPVSNNTTGNAVPNDTVTVVTGQQEAQINNRAPDELSETSTSHNHGLLTDANAFSQLNTSLTSALLERETRMNSKEELAELALRLLQTDKNFVDELWRAWKYSQEKSAGILTDNIIQATMSPTPAATEASTITSVEHGDEQPKSAHNPTIPHFALTKSAPANLPTLADGTGSALSDPVSPASLHSDLQHTLSESIIPVKDTMRIETERERSTSIGQSKTQEFWDEEESHVVESLL